MYKNRMKEIRKELGLSLKELAEQTGISVGYLCHLERGNRTNPSIEIMNKISEALGKSVSEIFFND